MADVVGYGVLAPAVDTRLRGAVIKVLRTRLTTVALRTRTDVRVDVITACTMNARRAGALVVLQITVVAIETTDTVTHVAVHAINTRPVDAWIRIAFVDIHFTVT